MPRNDRITRQWHLLRQLERSAGRSLQELVDKVSDDYPKNARTVRRDLEALEAVGFSNAATVNSPAVDGTFLEYSQGAEQNSGPGEDPAVDPQFAL